MIILGVAGGIASGKSVVASHLAKLGAVVLDADRLGHEVLREPAIRSALQRRWGGAVLDGNGEIDRRTVAARVFAPPPEGRRELSYLEQLTHPRIGERLRRQLDEWSQAGDVEVAVLDAPVMFKTGWNRVCDRILFVECPRELRLARARRRGWSESEFVARESAQPPPERARDQADWIIDNSGSVEHTLDQVDRIWQQLKQSRNREES